MGYPSKIVTCCYCGARAALVLKGKVQHELACSSCGAPLHELKMLPKAPKSRKAPRNAVAQYAEPAPRKPKKSKSYKQKRRRKSLFKKVFEEAFDLIEDVFD